MGTFDPRLYTDILTQLTLGGQCHPFSWLLCHGPYPAIVQMSAFSPVQIHLAWTKYAHGCFGQDQFLGHFGKDPMTEGQEMEAESHTE